MDNISFLTEILTSDHEYWVVAKQCMASVYGRYERQKDQILFICIPQQIDRGIKRDEIKLTQLENLRSIEVVGNLFLSDDYTPFQVGQTFYSIYKGYPIPTGYVNAFVKRALELKSTEIWDYKKIIDEIQTEC